MMNDQKKTKEKLLLELAELRQRIADLEISQTELRNENESLKKNQYILDALMEYIPEGITITDAFYSTMHRVNACWNELNGHPHEALASLPACGEVKKWDLFHANSVNKAGDEELPLARVIQTGEVICDEEWVLRRQDGQKISLMCNAGPIRGDDGKILGGLIAWRDITEREQLQETVRKAREDFEMEVKRRTAELSKIIESLQTEMIERRQAEAALEKTEANLHYLAAQLLTIQERERKWISTELHDDLGQSLVVLKLQINAQQRRLPAYMVDLRKSLGDSLQQLNEVIQKLRHISKRLHPAILEDIGLTGAIKKLSDDFRKSLEIKISLEMDDIKRLFPMQEKIIVYRILQEIFTNIAKHAHPTEVRVTVKKQEGEVAFLVEDNGQGFDLQQIQDLGISEKGLGLASIEERVRMLGGVLEILSEKGRGTRTGFTVPLTAKLKT